MKIIRVNELRKNYVTYERGSSFFETLKSVFYRKSFLVEAVNGVSFDIEEGELLGFLGPNGAGKSTTLKMLTGVLFPTSGEAEIMGFTPWKHRKKYVANIGAVFGQKSQLIWDIPPNDSFEMNRHIYDIPHKSYKETLKKMVEIMEAQSIINKPTRQLSLGERMKCEFIMAMLHRPKVVFLDEPTIGLDVIAKERIRDFILEMNKNGTTFILTTHDLGDVEQLARRVIVVNKGEIAYDNGIESLRSFFGNRRLVSLTTKKQSAEIGEMEGVAVTGRTSPYNVELEIDTDLLELNQFIKNVNENFVISDLSIGQTQIESVIKKLYVN